MTKANLKKYILGGPFFTAFVVVITEMENRWVAAGVGIGEEGGKGSVR